MSSSDLVETQPINSDSQEERYQQLREERELYWGVLEPCTDSVVRVNFQRGQDTYEFGRVDGRVNPNDPNSHGNDICIGNSKISSFHCTITLQGNEVIVKDLSSNGTYISSQKIGKDRTALLREGNELALGSMFGTKKEGGAPGLDDFRWLYRHFGPIQPMLEQEDEDPDSFWRHYQIGTELGRGTFASVYRVLQVSTGNWFAAKIIQRQKFAKSPANDRNFRREIEILQQLDHENVIRLIDFYETPSTYYLVMEEVTGGELLTYISKREGISEPEAKHITRQACTAIAYLHSLGITHRDLKPENILLTAGDPPSVKIADFGLAKIVDQATFLKTMCGTPSYLAPEVVLRDGPNVSYTEKVDSWSMGAICYAMITNTSPFIEDDTKHIRTRIEQRSIAWDALVLSGRVSQQGMHFIFHFLQEDPNERMSMEEALAHPWLAGGPGGSFIDDPYVAGGVAGGVVRGVTSESDAYAANEDLSMHATFGDGPPPTNAARDDEDEPSSQDFERLRLDSPTRSNKTNSSRFQQVPPVRISQQHFTQFSPERTPSGNIKVPGFSPMESQSQNSKRKAALAQMADGDQEDSSTPDDGPSLKIIGKRKVADRSGIFEDEGYFPPSTSQGADSSPTNARGYAGRQDSSPLSSPPQDKEEEDKDEDSKNGTNEDTDEHDDSFDGVSNRAMVLPRRQAKALKMEIDDSPGYRNANTVATRAPGSGRAGSKKPTSTTKNESSEGSSKTRRGMDLDDDDEPVVVAPTAKKAQQPRTRAKRVGM